MSDLLMLMSQLLTYEPLQPWELELDDAAAETSPQQVLADSAAQPQIADAAGIAFPEFSRAFQARKQLMRLQRTKAASVDAFQTVATAATPGEASLSASPTAGAKVGPTSQAATAPQFDFTLLNQRTTAPQFDFRGLNQSSTTPQFDFGNSAPTASAPNADNVATAPVSSSSLTANQILSYATTPQALSLAMQRVTMPRGPRPGSGPQLYQQRQMALQAGSLYTRLAPESFQSQWSNAVSKPTYEQWKSLLAREAGAIANGQGNNRLTVVVGDSLSLWLPPELLPQDRFWLNQGISGDTTRGVLNRLSSFEQTHPDVIHVMAGVNDLKNGASNAEVLTNLRSIMQRLRQQHPEARVIVHSILPTRLESIPSDRIRALNTQIAQSAQAEGVVYLDLHPSFTDEVGNLRYELTTDGIHLSRLGYQVWQIAMLAV
ncbi:MAG: GDSL-type esterase/lipase family protein [Cyanobacteria bacterium P01_G01_bin.38]